MHKQLIGRVVIMSRIKADILHVQAIAMLTEFLMKQESFHNLAPLYRVRPTRT